MLTAAGPPGSLPSDQNGLLLGSQGVSGYKWLQSYGGILSLNPVGNNVGIGRTDASYTLHMASGAHVTTGGIWTNASSCQLTADFAAIDRTALLEVLADLPITTWSYRAENASVRHLGPTAEDFYAAFGLGSDAGIGTVDADGVALATIQALYQLMAAPAVMALGIVVAAILFGLNKRCPWWAGALAISAALGMCGYVSWFVLVSQWCG